MILTKKYTIDANKATQGVWKDLDGARFLLAYYGVANQRFQFMLGQNATALQTIDMNQFDGYQSQQEIEVTLFAEAVLLDWEGVFMEEHDKEPLPYSKENAAKVLTLFPELRVALAQLASDQANYAYKVEAELVKN